MRLICCRFGTKFTDWHVNNLKHMIDNYSGLTYDSFEVIENDGILYCVSDMNSNEIINVNDIVLIVEQILNN